MSTKLFVGNLPYNVTGDDLAQLFSQAGNVSSATVITDKFSGRSKGFGFVEMASDEEAQQALSLNGHAMDGREIIVNEARPMQPREDRGGRGGSGGGGFRGGDRGNRGGSGGGGGFSRNRY